MTNNTGFPRTDISQFSCGGCMSLSLSYFWRIIWKKCLLEICKWAIPLKSVENKVTN